MASLAQMLDEAVAHLAASSAEQERYLRSLGSWPSLNELALEFDDVFGSFREQARQSSDHRSRALVELDDALAALSGQGNAKYWEPNALTWPEWEALRRLADAALRTTPVNGSGRRHR